MGDISKTDTIIPFDRSAAYIDFKEQCICVCFKVQEFKLSKSTYITIKLGIKRIKNG